MQGAEIVALCDRDPDRLARTAEAFEIERTYTDAASMLGAEDLDFVDVATTAPSHRPLVELAAGAGLHVICQKPFAPTMDDARAMVAAAERASRVLMVHENFRWQSTLCRVIESVRQGSIGTPFFGRVSFRSGFDVYAAQPYLAEGQRFIIEDLSIHALDVARALFGDATRIAATTTHVNPRIRGEDVATMLLTHKDGVTIVVDCSYAKRRLPETLLEIDGTDGTLRLDAGYRLVIHTDRESAEDLSLPVLPWAERPWHNIQESVLAIQQHFIDCLAEGRNPETLGADNLKTLALVEAAYRSAETGRTVELAEI
jgi:predicted dehydrogenase